MFNYAVFAMVLVHCSCCGVIPEAIYEDDQVPYLLCNELHQNQVLNNLAKMPVPKNGVHIGWSIEMNYKIILTRRPQYVFLCDINKRVFEFYDLMKELFLQCESSAEMLSLLESLIERDSSYFLKSYVKLQKVLASYSSWLTPEENFQYIKKMYQEERICHLVLNVLDQENRFSQLADWIKDHGYCVDTIYLSNVKNWISNKKLFQSNIQSLVQSNTLIIHANNKLGLTIIHSL